MGDVTKLKTDKDKFLDTMSELYDDGTYLMAIFDQGEVILVGSDDMTNPAAQAILEHCLEAVKKINTNDALSSLLGETTETEEGTLH